MTYYSVEPSVWDRLRAALDLWTARAYRYYGLVNHDRADFEQAITAYGQVIARNPAHARAYLERANLLWRELSLPRRALIDLQSALALRPDWPEALFARAMAHHEAGDYPGAIADLAAYLATGDRVWKREAQRQLGLMQALWSDVDEARSR